LIRQAVLLFPEGAEITALVNRRVGGLGLLDRQVRTLVRAGIEHISIVLPIGSMPKLTKLTQRLPVQLEITQRDQPPVLAHADEPYLLLLGEYVHHHSSLTELISTAPKQISLVTYASPTPGQAGLLHQAAVGFEQLEEPSGDFSTGAFLCDPQLLPTEKLSASGADIWSYLADASTTALVIKRSEPALWRRVDLPRGARAAKNMLFGQVTKKTSGFVSRHINARISIPTSKLLVETGLSPHAITVFLVMTTGLSSAYLVGVAQDYSTLALAGLLWQFAAIFDRCDGEVARVKLCESKFGAWFDTVTDNIAYICAYIGVLIGVQQRYPTQSIYLYIGISAIGALFLTLFVMYSYARKTGSGSLQHYLRALTQELPDGEKGWVQKLMERYGFVAKRDFFSFYAFLALLANQLDLVYWFLVTILHLAAAAVLLSQRKMVRSFQLSQNEQRPLASDAAPKDQR
jgi:phosphatidylglycerophosphate synthase